MTPSGQPAGSPSAVTWLSRVSVQVHLTNVPRPCMHVWPSAVPTLWFKASILACFQPKSRWSVLGARRVHAHPITDATARCVVACGRLCRAAASMQQQSLNPSSPASFLPLQNLMRALPSSGSGIDCCNCCCSLGCAQVIRSQRWRCLLRHWQTADCLSTSLSLVEDRGWCVSKAMDSLACRLPACMCLLYARRTGHRTE